MRHLEGCGVRGGVRRGSKSWDDFLVCLVQRHVMTRLGRQGICQGKEQGGRTKEGLYKTLAVSSSMLSFPFTIQTSPFSDRSAIRIQITHSSRLFCLTLQSSEFRQLPIHSYHISLSHKAHHRSGPKHTLPRATSIKASLPTIHLVSVTQVTQ